MGVCIGNSMISSDIWHKYHKWHFEIVIPYYRKLMLHEINAIILAETKGEDIDITSDSDNDEDALEIS